MAEVEIRLKIPFSYRRLSVRAFICFLASTIALAQVYSSLGGTVTDNSGAVIPGALVTVVDEGTGIIKTSASDATGKYKFQNLPPGTYRVTVGLKGFEEVRQEVVVRVRQASTVDVTMSAGSVTETVEVSSGLGFRVTSRELLAEDAREEDGFGLYSYLLFGSPPNEATRDRYLAVLGSFLDLPPTREMVKSVSRKRLNITYAPVKGHSEPSSAEELLQEYDFPRASGLLARISCTQREAPCGPYLEGPYIISTTKPLSDQASLSHHFLYQDLSSVPPRIVTLWIDEFMKQSAQAEFWKRRDGAQVALKLRTAVAVLGDGIPDVEHSADYWKKALAIKWNGQ